MVASSLAALGIAATALTLMRQAQGHIMHTEPVSRQYSLTVDHIHWSREDREDLAFAYNAGANVKIRPRAVEETDPDVLEAHGGGYLFPLHPMYSPLADNGNYEESNEIAKRHGVCGDPRKSIPGKADPDWKYSTPNENWQVFPTNKYTSGQILEMDIVMEYYHAGHIEVRLCDINDMDDPDGVVTQECLNMYQLDRAPDDGDASPIDPNYKGRYYVDPPCRKDELPELQQEKKSMHHTSKHYFFRARYVLPNIECEHCVLQMHYLSGHRCMHVGYEDFNPESWPGECAGNKNDWIVPKPTICGEGNPYPEEFWQCSDIQISKDASQPMPRNDNTDDKTDPSIDEEAYEDRGCVADKSLERIMTRMILPQEEEDEMTNELCMIICRDEGYKYSGTQWSRECFCGDDDTNHLQHGDGECDHVCAGDDTQICGGVWSMNVRELI